MRLHVCVWFVPTLFICAWFALVVHTLCSVSICFVCVCLMFEHCSMHLNVVLCFHKNPILCIVFNWYFVSIVFLCICYCFPYVLELFQLLHCCYVAFTDFYDFTDFRSFFMISPSRSRLRIRVNPRNRVSSLFTCFANYYRTYLACVDFFAALKMLSFFCM